jgi:hypothetical protein
MAEHKIYLVLSPVELGKVDSEIHIKKDDAHFGKIKMSKGGLDWYPLNAKKPYKIDWSNFDKLMKKNGKKS